MLRHLTEALNVSDIDIYTIRLVVTGNDTAKFKGSGTINGTGNYKFQIWAQDDNPDDTFRIKIWEEDGSGNETVKYDNGSDQPIGGGSIKVHSN